MARTSRGSGPKTPAKAAETPRPKGNNYIIVIFDSCRYDSMIAAKPKTIRKLGEIEKRWSYASWTAPSHYNLLSGLLPHSNPQNVFASEYYKKDFLKYSEWLQVAHPEALLSDLPEGIARLSHACYGVAAGAESADHSQ
jgi:hypothetical protein